MLQGGGVGSGYRGCTEQCKQGRCSLPGKGCSCQWVEGGLRKQQNKVTASLTCTEPLLHHAHVENETSSNPNPPHPTLDAVLQIKSAYVLLAQPSNVVGVHLIHIPGTNSYLFMERPSGYHPTMKPPVPANLIAGKGVGLVWAACSVPECWL